jgi:prevent-host-death family protein
MRAVTVRDLQRNVKACVDQAQRDRVVITRRGQPAALLVGVEGQGWEDVVLQADPGFWRLIRASLAPAWGGSFESETWSFHMVWEGWRGPDSHAPLTHWSARAPGLVWVRVGHRSLMRCTRVAPRAHSPRSDSRTAATSGRGPRHTR